MLNLDRETRPATYNELKTQLPEAKEPVLKNAMYHQSKIHQQRFYSKQETNQIIETIQNEFQLFDSKKRRDRIQNRALNSRGNRESADYPTEIFTHHWKKFKSVFGHAKKEQDPEDPISIFLHTLIKLFF